MSYIVEIKVTPHKELLDPQGKAVLGGLSNLGLAGVADVRVGKNITLQIDADSVAAAEAIAKEAAQKLLANPVMEYFEIRCEKARLNSFIFYPNTAGNCTRLRFG